MSMWEEIAKIIGGGGVMDQLPNERQGVRQGFGLEGASIQSSDLMDQLRNADRKEGAMPMGPRSGMSKALAAELRQMERTNRLKALLAGRPVGSTAPIGPHDPQWPGTPPLRPGSDLTARPNWSPERDWFDGKLTR